MNAYPEKQHYTADDLAAIIAILRDPDNGCPWDKVQTHRSIRMNFLEEAYEAVDAIDLDDPELLCEELGDVLMQVVFHAQIEREAGHFTFAEVCDGVCRKLLDRHPHIFRGDESIKDWDSLKNKEKGRLTLADDLESVPGALPALMRARKLQKRAAGHGVGSQTPRQAENALHAAEAARAAAETADQSRAKMEADMTALKQLHQAAQAGETQAREALAKAQAELKAQREKPVEVAVEVDQDALQEARREAETRMQAKVDKAAEAQKKAEEQRKKAEEELAAVRQQLEAANMREYLEKQDQRSMIPQKIIMHGSVVMEQMM